MSPRDVSGLLASYVYVFAVVGLGVLLARGRRHPHELTRKIVHVGVGTWVLPALFLFDHGWAAAIAPASFVVLNTLSRLFLPVAAVESGARRENWGTIYFPLSFALLLVLFWQEPSRWIVAAGILPMAWGDALAAEVGRRWGRHRYPVGGQWRSLEGSAAMFAGSVAGVFVATVAAHSLGGAVQIGRAHV
jgi:phytol kinase